MTPIGFDAGNPHPMTGQGNVTWLIDGAQPALVDAGVGRTAHVDDIDKALGGRPLAHVLVTHHHADHAGGVAALRARWPDIIAWKFPHESGGDWRALREGEDVVAGDSRLSVVHTPGHAPDHVCFWHAETRALFGGDMVLQGTTVMIPDSRGGQLREYLRSLERLAALDPRRIYPGHGPVIETPGVLIREYIAHRLMRDRQIRGCLAQGMTTAEEIAAVIYPGLIPELRGAALDTVRAHLRMIHDDAD